VKKVNISLSVWVRFVLIDPFLRVWVSYATSVHVYVLKRKEGFPWKNQGQLRDQSPFLFSGAELQKM